MGLTAQYTTSGPINLIFLPASKAGPTDDTDFVSGAFRYRF